MITHQMVFIICFIIIVLLIVLLWFLYIQATNIHAYYWIDKWNKSITNIRDVQNKIHDIDLPLSMQHAATSNIPAVRKLESLISSHHDVILDEVLALIDKGYYGYSMSDIDPTQGATFNNPQSTGWKPIWVKFLDCWAGSSKSLPTLTRIVKQMGPNILLLHVSVFWPPVQLPMHRGISKGVYRYHYGLSIPEGDTGMTVNNTPFKWTERRGVIWDDTLPHNSWNRTSQPRLVIFADIPRSLGIGWNWCNNVVHSMIQNTKHIKDIQNKLAQEGIIVD